MLQKLFGQAIVRLIGGLTKKVEMIFLLWNKKDFTPALNKNIDKNNQSNEENQKKKEEKDIIQGKLSIRELK